MWGLCREGNILLVGFMGAGKTTVAQEFLRTDYRFVDLDAEIVRRCGRSIPDLFSQEGEAFFRDCETDALRSLQGVRKTVIATGGGVIGREENWALMRQMGTVVFLRSSWEVLRKRLEAGEGRPLVDPADWPGVEALWRQRLPLYERADLIVDTEERSPAEVAGIILKHLDSEGEGNWKS